MCGAHAHRKFLEREIFITPCVCKPKHSGEHIYCVKTRQGIDDSSHALHYYREVRRIELEPIVYVDMQGKDLETYEECAALWQLFEMLRRKNH